MTLQRYELGEVYDQNEGEHKACLKQSATGSWIHIRDLEHLLKNKADGCYKDMNTSVSFRETRVEAFNEIKRELQ